MSKDRIRARMQARRLAMQAVYQWELSPGRELEEIRAQTVHDPHWDKADADYFDFLLKSCGEHADELAQRIAAAAERELTRIDPLERALLRNGACEILHSDTDPEIAIAEAVRLAEQYGGEGGRRFVNAVLDNIAQDTPLSERELIARYFTPAEAPAEVLLGVGDDAAVLASPDKLTVAVDTLVAGTHFADDAQPGDIGHKALAASLSDTAAMGAAPRWATLALTLPRATRGWARAFAGGFFGLAERHQVALVGGDVTRGPLTVTVQVVGELPGAAARRAGAQPEHGVYVTGAVGEAGVAWRDPERLAALDERARLACLARLRRPTPRVVEGPLIARYASAMIDISDGLLGDLRRLLDASGVGAVLELERTPMGVVDKLHLDPQTRLRALTAGDDYELLFTMPADDAPALRAELRRALGDTAPLVTRIGRVARAGDAELRATFAGKPCRLPTTTNYEHFA